ncbi:hypothetical protein D3C84_1280800 [compost metagenome]
MPLHHAFAQWFIQRHARRWHFWSVIGTAAATAIGLGLLEVGLSLGQRSTPVLL